MAEATRQTVIPSLRYDDAQGAIDWLREIFGMTEQFVAPGEDGRIDHAQISWRDSLVMLSSVSPESEVWYDLPYRHGSVNLTAESREQVDEIYARALAAGATVMQPLEDTAYGSHAFTIADAEGNLWHLGTYDAHTDVPDDAPGDAP